MRDECSDDVCEPPPYSEPCPHCPTRNLTTPLRVIRAPIGGGVSVTYMCSLKHTWTTGWEWWQKRPHPTDDDLPASSQSAGRPRVVSEW